MTCALCPVTVKRAMEGVEGVRSVEIDFEAQTAAVVFDPSITTEEAIAAASTNAGYPARAQG
jgi:mercuric ion binding protein